MPSSVRTTRLPPKATEKHMRSRRPRAQPGEAGEHGRIWFEPSSVANSWLPGAQVYEGEWLKEKEPVGLRLHSWHTPEN